MHLDDVFHCLATDTATAFAFGEPFGHLDSADFEHAANAAVRRLGFLALANRQLFGCLLPALKALPPSISMRISPAARGVSAFYKVW